MSRIKIVIPARYGSSRLPGKPLLEISGKPMFSHVVKRCLEAGFEEKDIIVATDDIRIFDKSVELSIPVSMTSSQHESGTDRVFEVAQKQSLLDTDIVINVQGDEPLVSPLLINRLANFARESQAFSINTVVAPISNYDDLTNPNVVKAIIGASNRALYFTRSPAPLNREDISDCSLAFRHIGIYAYSFKALRQFCSLDKTPLETYEKLEQLRALSHGMSIGVCNFEGDVPHGVDTFEDYLSIKNKME